MQNERKCSISKNEYVYSFLTISLIWLLLFICSGLFRGGFNYFLDDHEILLFHGRSTTLNSIFLEPFTSLFIAKQERFRPLYMLFLHLFSYVYDLKPFLWYLSSAIIAVFTTLIFYFFARKNFLIPLESMAFALLTIFGNQASTYARFGTPETTSTLFIALSFLCASIIPRRRILQMLLNGLFVLFAILAALNKEACILMLPALAFFRVWKYRDKCNTSWIRAIKLNIISLLILTMAFFSFLLFIKFMGISGPGYAGISKDVVDLRLLRHAMKTLFTKTSLSLALIIGITLIWWMLRNGHRISSDIWGLYLCCMLIILPQIFLYSKSGIDNHYLFPAVIGIAIITVFPLREFEMKYQKMWIFFMVVIGVLIIQHVYVTFKYQRQVTQTTQEINDLIKDISTIAGSNKKVLIFGNPYIHFEKLFGFKTVMAQIIGNEQTYLATYGSIHTMLLTQISDGDEKKWGYIDSQMVEKWFTPHLYSRMNKADKMDVSAIVLLSPTIVELDFKKWGEDWMDFSQYSEKQYRAIDVAVYSRK